MLKYYTLLTLILAQVAGAFALCNDCYDCETVDSPSCARQGNILSLGPELYRICRSKHGGTKQHGNAIGVRLTYDYIKRYNIYCGAQLFYGSGILNGHSGGGSKLRSRLTDLQAEASIGYTFQTKCFPLATLTPYLGGGYFKEINDFTDPSPIPAKFNTHYPYAAFGFLSSVYVVPWATVGLNARFRAPWEVRCKVTDDPDFENVTQQVSNELQFRIEVPFAYVGYFFLEGLEMSLVPFYERRLYGARENYPFNFSKTCFNIYGLNAQLIYRF